MVTSLFMCGICLKICEYVRKFVYIINIYKDLQVQVYKYKYWGVLWPNINMTDNDYISWRHFYDLLCNISFLRRGARVVIKVVMMISMETTMMATFFDVLCALRVQVWTWHFRLSATCSFGWFLWGSWEVDDHDDNLIWNPVFFMHEINTCWFVPIWVFPKIMVPQNGWFIREIPIKKDDLGVPLFLETPICTLYKSGPHKFWFENQFQFETFSLVYPICTKTSLYHAFREAKCRAPFTGMARRSDCPSRNTDPERWGDLSGDPSVEVWNTGMKWSRAHGEDDGFVWGGRNYEFIICGIFWRDSLFILFFHVKLQECVVVGSDWSLCLIIECCLTNR